MLWVKCNFENCKSINRFWQIYHSCKGQWVSCSVIVNLMFRLLSACLALANDWGGLGGGKAFHCSLSSLLPHPQLYPATVWPQRRIWVTTKRQLPPLGSIYGLSQELWHVGRSISLYPLSNSSFGFLFVCFLHGLLEDRLWPWINQTIFFLFTTTRSGSWGPHYNYID